MKKNSKYNFHTYSIAILLIVAAILRFYNFSTFSFSNDELSALNRLRCDSFISLIKNGIWIDGHPGGIQVFLFYWTKLFGLSEYFVRLPFVLSGIITIYFTYITASSWFNRSTGLFAASCLTFLEYPLLYSQIARPYSMGVLFVMMTAFFWTKILFEKEKTSKKTFRLYCIALSISIAACSYTHYFSFLSALIIIISGFLFVNKESFKAYLLSIGGGIALHIPHLPISFNHFSIPGVGLVFEKTAKTWVAAPENNWIIEYIFYALNNSYVLAFSILVVFGFSIVVNFKKIKINKLQLIVLFWFILPFLIAFFYSRNINPILQYSTLLFSFPFLLIFIFSFIDDKKKTIYVPALIIITIIGLHSTVVVNSYYNKYHFGAIKEIAQNISEWGDKYKKENITHSISINHPYYIDFYLERYNSATQFVQYSNEKGSDLLELKKIVDTANTSFFLFAWADSHYKTTKDIILRKYPYIAEHRNYDNLSEVTLFSKKTKHNNHQKKQVFHSFTNNFNDTTKLINEFCSTYSCKLSQEGNIPKEITVNTNSFCVNLPSSIQLVATLTNSNNKTYMWKSSHFKYYAEQGRWDQVFLHLVVPEEAKADDIFKTYIWNPKKDSAFVDDFSLRFSGN